MSLTLPSRYYTLAQGNASLWESDSSSALVTWPTKEVNNVAELSTTWAGHIGLQQSHFEIIELLLPGEDL